MHPKTLLLSGLFTFAMTFSGSASLLLYEPFDYGGSNGEIAGKGGAGGGWSDAWVEGGYNISGTVDGDSGYLASGLSFTTVPTSGGKAYVSSTGDESWQIGRQHSVAITGNIYGSFLLQTTNTGSSSGVISLFEGGGVGSSNAYSQFGIEPNAYGGTTGGVRTYPEGGTTYSEAGSITLPSSQTFMVLFKGTNLGPTESSHTYNMWTVSEAQYNHFNTDSQITETELNAAGVGTGSTQVSQRATHNVTGTDQFYSGGYIVAFQYYSAAWQVDEIRISDANLTEAATSTTVVPEPTVSLLLLPLALCLARRRVR